MFLEQLLLSLLGLSAGGIIAAGIFAFLAIIGIFPRLLGVTAAKSHIILCETMMILGGTLGNVMNLFGIPRIFPWISPMVSQIILVIWGAATGVFVGCLVMSLAETVKALPVLCRRLHLAVGLQYVIAAVAFGKALGAILYFVKGLGN